MKIQRLYLKNFKPIYSALSKYEIQLDLTVHDKLINVIVGKIGSCKTVILGHLQPFATFGTLDIRGQDDAILDGKEGRKELDLIEQDIHYQIQHIYHPTKTGHTIKSYIQKNGEELNPNGNVSSFKEWISVEFGMDPSYLRIIRLGTNVTNVIDMKASERKAFIASLNYDIEIYRLLHKLLTDDLREIRAQMNLLLGRIQKVQALDTLQTEYDQKLYERSSIQEQRQRLSEQRMEQEIRFKTILNGKSYEQFVDAYEKLIQTERTTVSEIGNLRKKIEQVQTVFSDKSELSMKIGTLRGEESANQTRLITLEATYQKRLETLSQLQETKSISRDQEQLTILQTQYTEIKQIVSELKNELEGFECTVTSSALQTALSSIDSFEIVLSEITGYEIGLIRQMYHAGPDILKQGEYRLKKAYARMNLLQKRMNSRQYLANYEPSITVYLPPGCPTDDCPYRISHPSYIASKKKASDWIAKEYTQDKIEMEKLQSDVLLFKDYPILFNRMQQAKAMWSKIHQTLNAVNCTNTNRLLDVLTNQQVRDYWYDHRKLIHTIELCEKREKYFTLNESLLSMKHELDSLYSMDIDQLETQIQDTIHARDSLRSEIQEIEQRNQLISKELSELDALYETMVSIDQLKMELSRREQLATSLRSEIQDAESNLYELNAIRGTIVLDQKRYQEVDAQYKRISEETENLRISLHEFIHTQEEFQKLEKKETTWKIIQKTLSSKEGIPLVFIHVFLRSCASIINELISDVFGDQIEILEFVINDNEFRIPYAINGEIVPDIEKASQGQKSIISLALSFALMRKSMNKFNIPLLDEVDAPLHKNDRQKFINILFKQLEVLQAEQVFLISHNNTFDGYNINCIMTTEETIDNSELITIQTI